MGRADIRAHNYGHHTCSKQGVLGGPRKELKEALDRVKHRVDETQWAELQAIYEMVTTKRHAVFPPGYEEAMGEDDDGQQTEMFARAISIFHSQSHQQKFREQRKLRGHASNPLEVGKFVAYVPDYTADTPATARHDFWVGKIVELNPDTDQLHVQR